LLGNTLAVALCISRILRRALLIFLASLPVKESSLHMTAKQISLPAPCQPLNLVALGGGRQTRRKARGLALQSRVVLQVDQLSVVRCAAAVLAEMHHAAVGCRLPVAGTANASQSPVLHRACGSRSIKAFECVAAQQLCTAVTALKD